MYRVIGKGLVCLFVVYFGRTTAASDPVAVYAVIERVELEPNAAQPQSVKLYGWFSMASENRLYQEPQHGWLYYSLTPDKTDLCRSEWKDLEELAGSGKCVAFGARHGELGKVVKKKERLDTPHEYPLASGLFAIRTDTNYPPVRKVAAIPLAASPAEDASVSPGRAELTAVNTRDNGHQMAQYVFDLVELKSGARLRSDPIPAGDRQTTWSSKMKLKPGERYSWQVEAIDGDWKVRSAETEFVVKESS